MAQANRQITVDQYTGPADSFIEANIQKARDKIAPELSRALSEYDVSARRGRLTVARVYCAAMLRDLDALLDAYGADGRAAA